MAPSGRGSSTAAPLPPSTPVPPGVLPSCPLIRCAAATLQASHGVCEASPPSRPALPGVLHSRNVHRHTLDLQHLQGASLAVPGLLGMQSAVWQVEFTCDGRRTVHAQSCSAISVQGTTSKRTQEVQTC